ncbi:MAG TPA: PD-(D/E)XK nuclease family protein [Cyclobacteriaceae bacterium]|nr:PD-(D/E)XK nuclease family protein [Cyclobacteriaceae bacterium]
MKPFLQILAEKLYKEHPQLDELTLVFPNRRAALYFRKYLTQLLSKPAFAPRLLTIEEFIGGFSSLQVPDKLELVHRLYKSYYKVHNSKSQLLKSSPGGEDLGGAKPAGFSSPAAKSSPSEEDLGGVEPFDQFYFWGDMLVRDFDEVDKYMVNADLLFKDLSNQKELDSSFDFLTDEQREFLHNFWGDFDDREGKSKKNFLRIWQRLPEVYQSFKKQLLSEGLGYEGLLHREVAEKLAVGELKPAISPTWFVGFNAFTLAEEKIISWFVEHAKAEVYWDLDAYYLNNETQEAGEFFRQYQNHKIFGKTFPVDIPANFQLPKSVKVLGAAHPVGQAKLMGQLLSEEIEKGIKPEETLIVLPDEKLMLPVLHGIPPGVDKLNVTMGYPLSNTPMFNLIELLVELQSNRKGDTYNHRQVLALLGHSYVVAPNPAAANEKRKHIQQDNMVSVLGTMLRTDHVLHKQIFCEVTEKSILDYIRQVIQLIASLDSIDSLDKEYALYFLKFLNRMEDVLGTEYSNLRAFLRLFRQLVKSQKIPFTGEPLKGLQVMGVLETRNLDFKNVFILSLNEGALPSGGGKGSYIPYNIRRAYQLPTVEHQDAIYAYLFYRVLQRAENVFLFYNSETDVLGQGEMSRYLQQLLYESGLKVERKVLHNPIQPLTVKPITITKNPDILDKLSLLNEGNVYFKGISPSALNSYIECRLKFYFRYIAKIKEPNEVEEDIDARVMGNFLHEVMEAFYKRIREKKKSKTVDFSDFDQAEKLIDRIIEEVFIAQYNLEPGKKVEFEGQRLVVREVVKRFAMRIVSLDKEYAPFTMEAIEQGGLLYRIKINQSPGYAVIGGKIDRVDRKNNLIRIIDYKTGKDKLDFESVPSLFQREERRNKAAFQTLLYALLYKPASSGNDARLVPGLINRMNLFEDAFQFGFTMNRAYINDVRPLLPEFEEHLRALLEEIFNPEEKFDQTNIVESCRICPYQNICYR